MPERGDHLTNIQGTAQATTSQMQSYIKRVNPKVAQSVINMIPYYISEGEAEGIRGDIAFAQSCLETGNFTFSGSAVTLNQNNFAGMGVTSNGMKGESWSTPQEGICAQIQHLKAYATTSPLNNVCVDKRYVYVDKGCAPYVEWLGIQENPKRKGWASGKDYGTKILNILNEILQEGTGGNMNIIETNLSFGSLSRRGATNRIILHHAEAKTCTPQQIHQWHKNNGWSGAGYHFLVRKDGSVYRLRPEWAIGAHAQGANSDSIGVCFEGSFMTEHMGQTQINAGKSIVSYLKGQYGISKVQAHRDVGSTNCPGTNFPFAEIAGASDYVVPTKNYLSKGDTGSAVEELQELLNKAGYNLTVDGDFGVATDKAVRDYQAKHGLAKDGCAGTATMASLRNTASGRTYMQRGDTGEKVRELQHKLNQYGGYGLSVDGDYGQATENAVKQFQNEFGLAVDGQAGNATIAKLDAEIVKISGQWVKQDGKWWYKYKDGSYPKNCWKKIDGKWYHFDASGWMQVGWIALNGTWYYLDTNGGMVEGWVELKGVWYYLTPESGAMKIGWLQLGDKWYYLKSDGAMACNELLTIGKEPYYFMSDGHMARTNARGALV